MNDFNKNKNFILSINGGSSSIKFSLYQIDSSLISVFFGEIENIGTKHTNLHFTNTISNQRENVLISEGGYTDAVHFLIDWFEKQNSFIFIRAIGHRIVYGMNHSAPEIISPELLKELNDLTAYDTEHMPGAIQLIEGFGQKHPTIPQVACFDTSFHVSMPTVAKLLPIPRRFNEKGIRRYGFHGLSYTYLLEEFSRLQGPDSSKNKIIMAHLGNGASLAAIKDGKSMDTSMGFTPASGIPMSTRTGDLDPGVAWYFMQTEKLSPAQFNHLINYESGLLGISETNSDMRELLKLEQADIRAAEAIQLFCYQIKKWIGAFAAVLGGLDTLIFSGGIGENAPTIRSQICKDLQFLGINLDEDKNTNNEPIISDGNSKIDIRVIQTNEELMIARLTCQIMNYKFINK